ncbi:MAG TPA: hypothetical protein VGY77_04075 [Gemmataceae bacterium]|jgi:hypothetical protein|nr:hypothetical protein [Gemmataceae bacterium]
MRINFALYALGICCLGSGCGLFCSASRNLKLESSLCVENPIACYRNHRLANATWIVFQQSNPDHPYSEDYADGFKQGFVEFLTTGGTNPAHPAPPKRYWKVFNQTLDGHRAMEEWLAGFTQGVFEAQASGYRQVMTIPAMPATADQVRSNTESVPAEPSSKETVPAEPVSEPILPAPRNLIPETPEEREQPGKEITNPPAPAKSLEEQPGKERTFAPTPSKPFGEEGDAIPKWHARPAQQSDTEKIKGG